MNRYRLCLIILSQVCVGFGYQGHQYHHHPAHGQSEDHGSQKMQEVFSWNQMTFDFDGVLYQNSTEDTPADQELKESERFFVQYNNVPIGMEVYRDRVFVTVPRRRHGIPSTLNYVQLPHSTTSSSPALKPYPDVETSRRLVSVYRPRVDSCGRLWVLDTGLLEVPGERRQLQPPAIIVFDLHTDQQILRYELKAEDLVNERSSGGLTSITVDVNPNSCADAYAYINDLATEGLLVFSMRERDSWRISHSSFAHDASALNFTVAGHTIPWQDGLFSIALSDPDAAGKRMAFYHPLVSTREFSVDTAFLKNKQLEFKTKVLGVRGPLTQSGSHDYHGPTRTILFANVAQDAVLCWNVDSELSPQNVAIVAQDHLKLVYISDLKVVGDDVWVLVNQIPRFVYSTLDPNEKNYYIHRAKVQDLIRDTPCELS